jgi:putative tryptophan/tyrosine transport system substrate-binding protein
LSEGKNLVVERLSGLGQTDRILQMARDAVEKRPDAIFNVTGNIPFIWKSLKTTIPIVTTTVDPVAIGLVESIAHPGGNITGVSIDAGLEIWGKRIGLLREVIPRLSSLSVIAATSQKDWDEGTYGAPARQAAKGRRDRPQACGAYRRGRKTLRGTLPAHLRDVRA